MGQTPNLQANFLVKSFITLGAGEWFFSCVGQIVFLQVIPSHIGLATFGARIRCVGSLPCLVLALVQVGVVFDSGSEFGSDLDLRLSSCSFFGPGSIDIGSISDPGSISVSGPGFDSVSLGSGSVSGLWFWLSRHWLCLLSQL